MICIAYTRCTDLFSSFPFRSLAVDGVIEISLLKKNRRGYYDDGCTNHDTFWRSLLADVRAVKTLPSTVPSEYFETEYEIEREPGNDARKSSSKPMISQRR